MKQLILKDGTTFDLKMAQKVFSYDRGYEPPKEKNLVSMDIDITDSVDYDEVVAKLNSQESSEFTVKEDETSYTFTDYELWTIVKQLGPNVDVVHVEYMKKVGE